MLHAVLAALLASAPAGQARAPAPAAHRPAKGAPASAAPAKAAPPGAAPKLADALLEALREAHLEDLHDAGPDEGKCPGAPDCPWPLPRVRLPPHVDLAVIRLDASGRAVEAANVQLDPAAPRGRIVPLDRDLAATGVRFQRWSPARREAGLGAAPYLEEDLLAPARGKAAPVDFMAPYPASIFKLLLAFHLERRIAARKLTASALVEESPPPGAPEPGVEPRPLRTRPLSEWVEAMITESDNQATRTVLRHLHAHGEVERMNAELAALGLGTLRVDGTSAADGSRWAPGEIHATAMDLARLLWLVEGGPGVLWRTPDGRPIRREALPESARKRLKALLAGQGFHDTLSGASLCGLSPPGIPSAVPGRFIDPVTGWATVGETRFARDVRPCGAAAEVRFLHKTGLTWNYAADAGLVESLPGQPFRRYVVVLVSAAGTRFVDPERAAAPRHPCTAFGVCSTRRFARLGAAVDASCEAAARPPPRRKAKKG